MYETSYYFLYLRGVCERFRKYDSKVTTVLAVIPNSGIDSQSGILVSSGFSSLFDAGNLCEYISFSKKLCRRCKEENTALIDSFVVVVVVKTQFKIPVILYDRTMVPKESSV